MSWFSNVKLGTKFNLMMSFLLLSLFVAAALLTYNRQRSLILKIAVDNARNFAKVITETREYMSSVVRGEPEKNYGLVPQVVATQVATRLTKDTSYYVRQVSLRYRNPNNRPDAYEEQQLELFKEKPARETWHVVTSQGKEVFRYMLPMFAEKSCLKCHGDYDKAPLFVRQRFPRGHFSYNYKIGEVIGAVSVTIPMTDLYHNLGTNLKLDLAYRGAILLIIITVMAVLMRKIIIGPVKLLSSTMLRVTRTGSFTDQLPQKTTDEIGLLIAAFNEMMRELQFKTVQSRESEERYRNFIEMAQSAVVTFMEDGKIIIANQKAEELFGLSRQALLGEDIFTFLENGDELREELTSFGREGGGGNVRQATLQKVKDSYGGVTEVDMILATSTTDHKPLLTALLMKTSGEKQ